MLYDRRFIYQPGSARSEPPEDSYVTDYLEACQNHFPNILSHTTALNGIAWFVEQTGPRQNNSPKYGYNLRISTNDPGRVLEKYQSLIGDPKPNATAAVDVPVGTPWATNMRVRLQYHTTENPDNSFTASSFYRGSPPLKIEYGQAHPPHPERYKGFIRSWLFEEDATGHNPPKLSRAVHTPRTRTEIDIVAVNDDYERLKANFEHSQPTTFEANLAKVYGAYEATAMQLYADYTSIAALTLE